jgi:hypothetical protein
VRQVAGYSTRLGGPPTEPAPTTRWGARLVGAPPGLRDRDPRHLAIETIVTNVYDRDILIITVLLKMIDGNSTNQSLDEYDGVIIFFFFLRAIVDRYNRVGSYENQLYWVFEVNRAWLVARPPGHSRSVTGGVGRLVARELVDGVVESALSGCRPDRF